MKEIFSHFLTAGLSGSVLILAVILARLVLSKAPKRFVCLLWLLVGLRLLIPFTVESKLSLQPEQSAVPQLGAQVLPTPSPAPVLPEATGNQDSEPIVRPSVPITDEVPATVPSTDTALPDDAAVSGYGVIAAWVWSLAAGTMLGYALISYRVLKHKLRWAVPLESGVFEDPSVRSPFLLGYLKPRIYLPSHAVQEHRVHILAHERCHIRRGDNWVKLIGFICLALHWYNPLVWLAYSLLCKDMEMACDEAVIRTMDTQQRKAYSAALLSCAAGKQGISACPVAFGEDNVKQRILKVLHYKKPAFGLSVLAVVAMAVIAVCFLTNPAKDPDPAENEYLEKCREAVVQLQSANSYSLSQSRQLHTTDDSWYSWDTAFHLRSGDNQYHRFESPDMVSEYFAYDGRQFAKNTTEAMPEEDLTYPEWTKADLSTEEMLQNFCWLLVYEWDDNAISLKEVSEDGCSITLSVALEDADVIAETLQFRFDSVTDQLTAVTRIQQLRNGFSASYVRIRSGSEAENAATLSDYYQRILTGGEINLPSAGIVSAAILTPLSDREYEEYKTFFYSRFGSGNKMADGDVPLFGKDDKVIFADVTHDSEAEMLVLHPYSDGELCYGLVFTIDASGVRLIYSNYGGADHASGFYGWYLRPAENGYDLAEETFGMSNGIGTLSFEEYYLRPDGQRVSVDRIYVSSDDPESRDEAGAVSEEAADYYARQLNERISKFYLVYRTATQSTVDCLQLDDNLWQLFQ